MPAVNRIIVFVLLMLLATIIQAAPPEERDSSGNYIGGFVLGDDNSTGLKGVRVIINHEFDTLMSIETDADGWFETSIPIDEKITKVHLSFIKTGYQLVEKDKVVTTGINTLSVNLQKIPNYSVIEPKQKRYFKNFYGYVNDPINNKPLKGAVIRSSVPCSSGHYYNSTTVTRDSGYFTISYPISCVIASNNTMVDYDIIHSEFNTKSINSPLEQQNHPIETNKLQEKIDWLIRLTMYNTPNGTKKIPQLTINFMEFKKYLLPNNHSSSNYAFPYGALTTKDKLVKSIDVEKSRIISGKGYGNLIWDYAVGWARIESRYKDKNVPEGDAPHFSTGIRYKFDLNYFHFFLRSGYSGYLLKNHWNGLLTFDIGT